MVISRYLLIRVIFRYPLITIITITNITTPTTPSWQALKTFHVYYCLPPADSPTQLDSLKRAKLSAEQPSRSVPKRKHGSCQPGTSSWRQNRRGHTKSAPSDSSIQSPLLAHVSGAHTLSVNVCGATTTAFPASMGKLQ